MSWTASTTHWLGFGERNESDHSQVATLWCNICRKNEDRMRGMRNFSSIWVSGSTNHKTSNIVDHATSDQHTASLAHQQATSAKTEGKPVESYAPIAHSLLVMDGRERRRMKQRFEICYMMAQESMAFFEISLVCPDRASRSGPGFLLQEERLR